MAERRDAYERARSNAGEDRITLKALNWPMRLLKPEQDIKQKQVKI
jgi:hypothetical protein